MWVVYTGFSKGACCQDEAVLSICRWECNVNYVLSLTIMLPNCCHMIERFIKLLIKASLQIPMVERSALITFWNVFECGLIIFSPECIYHIFLVKCSFLVYLLEAQNTTIFHSCGFWFSEYFVQAIHRIVTHLLIDLYARIVFRFLWKDI